MAETVITALEDANDYQAFEAAITAEATMMETGLFEIEAEHVREYRENRRLLPDSRDIVHTIFRGDNPETTADAPALDFAHSFLPLANLPNFALDRLSHYEATLWRQAGRIIYALKTLDRRKPQERMRRRWFPSEGEIEYE
jgi:hypothetical protein